MNEADVSKAKDIDQAARAPYLESTLEQVSVFIFSTIGIEMFYLN